MTDILYTYKYQKHLTRNTVTNKTVYILCVSMRYHLGGLNLPGKSVVRLTDRPDMTLDVYRARKTTTTTNHSTKAPLKTLYMKNTFKLTLSSMSH